MKNLNFIRLHKIICNYCIHNKIEYSQQEIKNNISKYGVYIDKKLVNNHLEKVLKYQKTDISHWPIRTKGDFNKLNILYENDNFLAIYKPKNTVVEKGTGHVYDNIIHHLEEKLGQELFSIHRLDKDTSGVMVIAKSQKDKDIIQDLFRKREVEKEYLALIDGEVEGIFNITHWQSRDKSNMLRQKLFFDETKAMEYSDKSRKCSTIVKPFLYCPEKNISLVKVKILSGRMHQIRVLMEALGLPLYKDKIYNNKINTQVKPVYTGYKMINEESLMNFLNNYNNTQTLDYFLSSYILCFTLLETKGLKNYSFNLLV